MTTDDPPEDVVIEPPTAPDLARPPRPPALVARGAAKRYRRSRAWALLDVDLAIPAGSVTALVGPNGAGKSTLIRSWIGFEGLTRGSVEVEGIDPQRHREEAVRRLGYVSQATLLYRGLTVGDHLVMAGAARQGFDRATAEQRLDGLGIPLGRRAGTLSGGQAAQVALCLALGSGAPVLLLDEPLASLDPLARHEFLDLLATTVRGRGTTAVLSSHIVSDVEAVCDRLVVLGMGRVMLQAPIAQALSEHRLTHDDAPPGVTVATIAGPGGHPMSVIRSSDPSLEPPTLEELVMAYLAAARLDPAARDGRAA